MCNSTKIHWGWLQSNPIHFHEVLILFFLQLCQQLHFIILKYDLLVHLILFPKLIRH